MQTSQRAKNSRGPSPWGRWGGGGAGGGMGGLTIMGDFLPEAQIGPAINIKENPLPAPAQGKRNYFETSQSTLFLTRLPSGETN